MLNTLFLTPTLTHNVAVEFKNSIIETDRLLARHGIRAGYMDIGGDPYLAKVRNHLATRVLDEFPTVENIFWVDDDVGWPAEAAMRFIHRPEMVVAGVYPKKQATLDFPVTLLQDKDTGKLIESNGLYAASMVPTGFLRWKRPVLELMAQQRPRYIDMIKGEWREFAEVFRTGVLFEDRKWYGEDPAFCEEWTRLGGEIWVDPNIPFTHRGGNKWSATLADHLAKFKHNDGDQNGEH